MRSLLQLMTCCVPVARPALPATPSPVEETLSLMEISSSSSPLPCTGREPLGCRTRGSLGGSRSSVKREQWRPSLCAISEDKVVPAVKALKTIKSDKKQTGKAGSKVKARFQTDIDEYRQPPLSAAIPAFSPMPFLF